VSTPRDPRDEPTVVADGGSVRRREEIVEEAPPPRPPRIWPWLLLLLLLVLGGLIAYFLLTREEDKTTMPRVVGLTESAARIRLAEANVDAETTRRRSERQAGIVFAQAPGAGVQLDEGENVRMFVSNGRALVTVPSVRDLREQEAVSKLEAAGFKTRTERVFAGAPKGVVVEQEPRGGERAPRQSTVVLTVSKGRNLAPVPDVVGQQERQAVSKLRAAGFTPRLFDVPSPEPQGVVIAQQPPGGEQAPPDSRVRLNVSTGDEAGQTTERPTTTTPATTTPATTTPATGRVTVPSVVGLAQTPALRRLQNAGLRGVVSYRTSDQPRGRVIAQRPRTGQLNRDASVQIVVSSGANPEALDVPDVTGVSEDEARQTLEDAGFRVDVIRTGDGTTVEDQLPESGATAYRGAVITLFVG
jgi:eukaryotic-like serine/threonine-protein kinase